MGGSEEGLYVIASGANLIHKLFEKSNWKIKESTGLIW